MYNLHVITHKSLNQHHINLWTFQFFHMIYYIPPSNENSFPKKIKTNIVRDQ